MLKKSYVGAWLVLLVASNSAAGTTVVYDDASGYATGIENLFIDGIYYDVDFVSGSYVSVYEDSIPMFMDDEIGASNAAIAIRDVLNLEPVVPQIAIGSSEALFIPFTFVTDQSIFSAQVGHNTDFDAWVRYGDFIGGINSDFSGPPFSWLYTTFTSVPVPIPASFFLLLSGISLLMFRASIS